MSFFLHFAQRSSDSKRGITSPLLSISVFFPSFFITPPHERLETGRINAVDYNCPISRLLPLANTVS
jgi:hypothetical protein